MSTETQILEALFSETGGAIPADRAPIVPKLLWHIGAMISLAKDGSDAPKRQYHHRITDPVKSSAITDRIMELYAQLGPAWREISLVVGQEFQQILSSDSIRNRCRDRLARLEAEALQKEGYAALSGEAIDKQDHIPEATKMDTLPALTSLELEKLPTKLPKGIPIDCQRAAVQEDNPVEPAQNVPLPSGDPDTEALKAEILELYAEGKDIKAIAEKLDVRWQWVRSICSRAQRPPKEVASEPKNVAPVLPDTPNVSDVRNVSDAQSPKGPEPKSISRHDLDTKIWNIWKKQGKTPAEISDLLCDEGYYYGEKSVRTRLLNQGAKL